MSFWLLDCPVIRGVLIGLWSGCCSWLGGHIAGKIFSKKIDTLFKKKSEKMNRRKKDKNGKSRLSKF